MLLEPEEREGRGLGLSKLMEVLERRVFLTTTPNDALYASQWGLEASGAPSAWDTTRGSAAVVVAGIDTGIDYRHEDLYLNIWINPDEIPAGVRSRLTDADGDGAITFYDLNDSANRGRVRDVDRNGRIDAADLLTRAKYGGWANGKDDGGNGYRDDIVGWDFAEWDNNPIDRDGHGTHTAGTIAAVGNNGVGVAGVAWRASLMALKIFDDAGEGTSARGIAAAIRYAADNGARVSNNSWGGGFSSLIYNAVAYAAQMGHVFVAAAGNDGANLDSSWYDEYPAEFELGNVITVGASDSSGDLTSWSNYGSANVDVVAPGSSILSTYPRGDYRRMSGTSMATPHVTGAVALMLSRSPGMPAGQVKAAIVNGADQNAGLIEASVSGGELNLTNALLGRAGRRHTAPEPEEDEVVGGGGDASWDAVYVWVPGRGWVQIASAWLFSTKRIGASAVLSA
jgi:subtilisin family serine protease